MTGNGTMQAPSLVRAINRGGVREVHSCGFPVPASPGRYPKNCPLCGGQLIPAQAPSCGGDPERDPANTDVVDQE